MATLKHKNGDNGIDLVVNGMSKIAKPYICHCGKEYSYDSGYYRHKKKCSINSSDKWFAGVLLGSAVLSSMMSIAGMYSLIVPRVSIMPM